MTNKPTDEEVVAEALSKLIADPIRLAWYAVEVLNALRKAGYKVVGPTVVTVEEELATLRERIEAVEVEVEEARTQRNQIERPI